jgi:hypothetical protein
VEFAFKSVNFSDFTTNRLIYSCVTSFLNDVAKELLSWEGILINSILAGVYSPEEKTHTFECMI